MHNSILFNLDGEVAVVTGACGKLGVIWMEGLLLAGAKVIGVELTEQPLSNKCIELQARYGASQLSFFHADITDKEQLINLRQEIEERHGVVSILVNNAGVDQPGGNVDTFTLIDFPGCQFHDVFAMNVDAAMQVTQVFAEPMLERHYGSIINIGSIYADGVTDSRLITPINQEISGMAPSMGGSSKAAVVNLTQYLARHWAANGVRVNSLSPAGLGEEHKQGSKQETLGPVSMGRMAQPQDLIGPLVFLASEASACLTGQELCVHSGISVF